MPHRLFTLLARNYAHCSQLPHWQGIMPPLFNNYTTGKELCRADYSQLHYWQGITPTVHSCPTGKELCRRCLTTIYTTGKELCHHGCLTTTPQTRNCAAQIVRNCSSDKELRPLFTAAPLARNYAAVV